MKQAVPKLIFILILILKQAPSEVIADQRQGSCLDFHELNLLSDAHLRGWLEVMEKADQAALLPVFEAFQSGDTLFLHEATSRPIRYLPRCITNPLLYDRPPPVRKPELISFA